MTDKPAEQLLNEIGIPVLIILEDFLNDEIKRWSQVDESVTPFLQDLLDFIRRGGKRLRPAFCDLAYRAFGGVPENEQIEKAKASLELLHTFALIHDDVMDKATTRRGQATVHEHYAALHKSTGGRGQSDQYGIASAILMGDMAFVYADSLTSSMDTETKLIFDEMRIELNIGQFLDIHASSNTQGTAEKSRQIAQFKSGKYTIERPMHIGVSIAGKLTNENKIRITNFGLPIGEAFQLTDDLIGAFGSCEDAGKSGYGDIVEGKPTLLFRSAQKLANSIQLRELESHYGSENPNVDTVRQIFVETGAKSEVEKLIFQLTEKGLKALDEMPIDSEMRDELRKVAIFVSNRDR